MAISASCSCARLVVKSVCASSTLGSPRHFAMQRQLPLQGFLRRSLDGLRTFQLGSQNRLIALCVFQVDLGTIELGLLDIHIRDGHLQCRFGLIDLCGERPGIDLRQRLVFPDRVVEVDVNLV